MTGPESVPPAAVEQRCSDCGAVWFGRDSDSPFGGDYCPQCARKYPDALIKATGDSFDYALGLRSGEVLFFTSATIHGDWVHLEIIDHPMSRVPERIPFDRGVDVRLADIVWCADAPFGS